MHSILSFSKLYDDYFFKGGGWWVVGTLKYLELAISRNSCVSKVARIASKATALLLHKNYYDHNGERSFGHCYSGSV